MDQQQQSSPKQHNNNNNNNNNNQAPATNGHKNAHSPLHQVSYHKQQQIHQRHIQKIGGVHMLTVDLAGQFQEAEQQPVASSPTSPARGQAKLVRQSPLSKPRAQSETQQQRLPMPAESPEQVELIRSDGSEVDPIEAAIRDARETADDAAILKRYKICNLVGQGNYARVYRGIFPANNREVAIKSINMNRATENYRQKFLPRELSILKRINHVNICKTHEILQSTDRVFIVMQYCSRGTMADLLQRNQGPLSESVARHLFAGTIDAICYLHALDIAHRDIKIENILLDHEFTPKLADFSYSCWLTDSYQSSESKKNCVDKLPHQQKTVMRRLPQLSMRLNETFCGTLPYLSPEMIRQFPYDSRKTDVWSLGVCLYVVLNDRLPFPFNDIKLMVKRQLTRDFKIRSGVDLSETCRDLMQRLLEPDFTKRISAHEANRHAWLNGSRERPAD